MAVWKFSTNSILLNNTPVIVFHAFSLQQTSTEKTSWQFDLFIKSCATNFLYTSIILTQQQSLLVIGNKVTVNGTLRNLSLSVKNKLVQITNEYLPSNFTFKPVSGYKIKHDFPHFSYAFVEAPNKQLTANNKIYEFYEFKKLHVEGIHHSVLIKALSASPTVSLHFALSHASSRTTAHALIQFCGTTQQIMHEKAKLMKTLLEYPNITGELSQLSQKFVMKNPGRCLFGLTKSAVSAIEINNLLHDGPMRFAIQNVLHHTRSIRTSLSKSIAPSPVLPSATEPESSVSVTASQSLQSNNDDLIASLYLQVKDQLSKYGWKELKYISKYELATFHLGEITAKVYLSKESAQMHFSHTREFLPDSYLLFVSNRTEEIVADNYTIKPLTLNLKK